MKFLLALFRSVLGRAEIDEVEITSRQTFEPRCPDCEVMLELEQRGVTLFRCERCYGMWLGPEALSSLLRSSEAVRETVLELEGEEVELERSTESRERRGCCFCGEQMDHYQFDYASGIWVDSCPLGHGLWLDAGELKQIIEYRQRPSEALSTEQKRALLQSVEMSMEQKLEHSRKRAKAAKAVQSVTRKMAGLTTGRIEERRARHEQAERDLANSLSDLL